MLTIPRWHFTSQQSLTRNSLPPRLRRDYLVSFGPELGESFYLKSVYEIVESRFGFRHISASIFCPCRAYYPTQEGLSNYACRANLNS